MQVHLLERLKQKHGVYHFESYGSECSCNMAKHHRIEMIHNNIDLPFEMDLIDINASDHEMQGS